MIEKNKYIIGDNINILNKLKDESFQLCYIDPPYNTGRDFGDFNDDYKTNLDFAYKFIKPRIEIIHKKLKKDGTIAVHCDSKASHYIRLVLDEVFGEKNFKNEIIWVTTGNKKTTRLLARSHDSIFIYSKSNKQKFKMIYLPYEDTGKKHKSDERGEYTTSAAHN